MTNIFGAIAFDIFNVSLVGCGIVFGVALVLAVLILALRCHVVYFDSEDGNSEIHREKHSWLSKVKIHGASKKGKKLVGWSKDPKGKKPLLKHKVVLFHNIKLYAIWQEAPVVEPAVAPKAEIPKDELDYNEGIIVKFNYIDPQTDEVISSEGFRLNAHVPSESVEGWGFASNSGVLFKGVVCEGSAPERFAPEGGIIYKNEEDNYVFNVNLYPVVALQDSDVEIGDEPFGGECIVDISYTKSSTDSVIYKESHYITLKLPNIFDENDKFLGWSIVPDGDVAIERGDVDTIFAIPLYSIGDVAEEAVAEPAPVEEPVPAPVVVAEPVEEVAEEEPVAEPVVEEEPVAAEPIEEEKPLYEEIIEEYIPEPKAEEPVVEEEPVTEPAPVEEEPATEPAPVEAQDEHSPVLVPTYYDNAGNKIDIKYSRSFTANLIQSDDTVKNYYSELKNHILSYKGVKSKISWKFDSYNRGRDQLFKIKLRGKTVCLYCALDPNEFDESKYHHEAIDAKIFADVPMLVKIKSGLGLRKAKELVDITMAKFNIEKDEKAKTVDYVEKYPYEPNEPLLARKLIKMLLADDAVVVMSAKPKDEPKIEPIPEPAIEAPIEEPAVEPEVEVTPIEEPAAEPEVEVTPIVEPEEEVTVVPAVEPVVEEEPYVEPEIIVETVSAEEAHQIIEEKHVELHVEEGVDYIGPKDNKKAIINIDTLSKNYEAHDLVTIQSMKDKKLIDKKSKCVKVLARGTLNKPLRVKAGEFSATAVEMLLLTGGQAMHVVYKVKK